eukprot:5052395-Pleurochrysis_carterae.AAC.1
MQTTCAANKLHERPTDYSVGRHLDHGFENRLKGSLLPHTHPSRASHEERRSLRNLNAPS